MLAHVWYGRTGDINDAKEIGVNHCLEPLRTQLLERRNIAEPSVVNDEVETPKRIKRYLLVKSTKSRNLVQNRYKIFFTSQQVLQSLTKLIRNGKAKGRLMAAGFRWVDGSHLLFVEPRLIGNLDVVSVRVADVCREVVGTPFGPKARFLV